MQLTTALKNRLRVALRRCQSAGMRCLPRPPLDGTHPVRPVEALELRTPSGQAFNADNARQTGLEAVNNGSMENLFHCQINDFPMIVPAKVLRLYPHCLHPSAAQHLTYYVETSQSRWLCSKLGPGDTAFDIGAATGLLSLAMSRTVGHTGKVYSFEPSRATFRTLQALAHHNELTNVEPIPAAIGADCGEVEFIEFLASRDGDWSWAPDASTIATGVAPQHPHQRYQVKLTTIDSFATALGASPRAIKIDIEGFEIDALEGGEKTIRRCRPFLCIDIHTDPRTRESSRTSVEGYLSARGYRHFMEAHALYAEHPDRGDC